MASTNSLPIVISLAIGIAFLTISLAVRPPPTPPYERDRYGELDDTYVEFPCENVQIISNDIGTFYTCPHPSEISNVVITLPSPVYKRAVCTGCAHPYVYTEIVPSDLLSEQEKQMVIEKVMTLPETKLNSGWTLDHFIIHPREDKWIGDIQLFIDGIKQLPPSQECGWYGSVQVDLETLEIIDIGNIPPRSDVKC